jgi:hypothetical protein
MRAGYPQSIHMQQSYRLLLCGSRVTQCTVVSIWRETSLVRGLTKLMTEFEFNDCSMNIQARERSSYRG